MQTSSETKQDTSTLVENNNSLSRNFNNVKKTPSENFGNHNLSQGPILVRVTNVMGQTISVVNFQDDSEFILQLGEEIPNGVFMVEIVSGDNIQHLMVAKTQQQSACQVTVVKQATGEYTVTDQLEVPSATRLNEEKEIEPKNTKQTSNESPEKVKIKSSEGKVKRNAHKTVIKTPDSKITTKDNRRTVKTPEDKIVSTDKFVKIKDRKKSHPAHASEVVKARQIIKQFKDEGNTPTKFPNYDKAKFIADLKKRVGEPEKLDQGNLWLCGPSAASYVFSELDPINYAKVMISLYKYGKAKVKGGRRFKMSKKAIENVTIKSNGKVKDGQDVVMLDYMLLSALRRTENVDLLDLLNPFRPMAWLGSLAEVFFKKRNLDLRSCDTNDVGTFPWEMNDFLKRYLRLKVKKSRYYGRENLKAIEQASKNIHQKVILLIDISGLSGSGSIDKRGELGSKDSGFYGKFGIHYVVIRDNEFKIHGDQIDLKYWDHGNRQNNLKDVPIKRFRIAVKGYWIVEGRKKREKTQKHKR